ncbi:hypothetical protein [Dehalococcoides mccartyi]|uniref:hypothetical protein n=1 Tax=Dehalococcoides mccartyi TaxID=61435 RepID=UPI00242A6D6B|nr:hypothetical protein [Dehalococcoides mccartyi]
MTYCHIQRTSMPALFAGTLRLLLTAKRHLLLIYTSFWRFHQVNFQRIKRIKTKPCGSKTSSCGHDFWPAFLAAGIQNGSRQEHFWPDPLLSVLRR